MKLKTKKLCKLRWKMIKEHMASWIIFLLAIIFSVCTSFLLSHYNTNGFNESRYAISLLINTLSIGYFSAFLFYIFHDFLPHSRNRLEDIQKAIRLELPINDYVENLEDIIFKQLPPIKESEYVTVFCDKIIEYYVEEGQNKVKIIDPLMGYLYCMSLDIERCKNLLQLMDKEVVPPEIFNALTLIDVYQVIQRKKAFEGLQNNTIDVKSLSLIIADFKEHKEYLKKHLDSLDKYSYITKKIYVPYT